MSQTVTMTAGAANAVATSELTVVDLVRPMLEGSFGADWQRRAKVVYALKSAWQAGGELGEEELIARLNDCLKGAGCDYRVQTASMNMAEVTARILELKDLRIGNVVDRQSFVF
jgi:hypothetical protein